MTANDYPPGTTVFAKLKGFPWWPARIEAEENVPREILRQKSKSKGPLWTVFFYGSRDYGFFPADAIRPFDRTAVERDLAAKRFKTKKLEQAVRQALDPTLLETDMDNDNDREEGEEGGEEEEEEEVETPKRRTRKKTNHARSNSQTTDDLDEAFDGHKPKGRTRKLSEKEIVEHKKRRKSELADLDHLAVSDATDQHTGSYGTKDSTNSGNHRSAEHSAMYRRVYVLRHKLQRLVYHKRPGEIPYNNYAKIAETLDDIESLTMTPDLLKETKIGKVMKAACVYDYGDVGDYNLRERCHQLIKKWKELLAVEYMTEAVER